MNYKFSFFLLLTSLMVRAQESAVADLFRVDYETPLTIELKNSKEEEEAPVEVVKKKKKPNPKIYYGIKTKRGYTKTGFKKQVVTELFFYLKTKDYQPPDSYTRDFFWYDFKQKKIVNSLRLKNPKDMGVMHGHYVKKIGDQILEEGYFYKGKKHRRWVRFNSSDILMGKEVYWKGWTQESLLAFYDFQRQQIKEVIPVHFGEKEGTYYAFHQDGSVAATGLYKFDNRIGTWREYYPNNRLKREINYPLDPYDKANKPYISKEWDENGRLIYTRAN